MRSRALHAGWLAALVLVVLAPPAARGQVPGEHETLLVRLRGPVDADALERLEARTGGRVERVIPALRLVRLVTPADGQGGAAAARSIAAPDEIESVRPDGRGRGGAVSDSRLDRRPDDPGFPLQWHLENTGQGGGRPGADLGALAAWERSRGNEAIVVAILDTGVDPDDPDLAGRLLPGIDLVNGDGDPSADHPHGTQVARLFGANAGNGVQVAGVDPAARILPVKVLDAANEGWESDLIAGLLWAADAGADVVSMSLIDYPADSPDLSAALAYARDAGAVLVACAGNGGAGDADVSGPGAYPETISVGWTDATDALGVSGASSSATGAALDFVAPGASLVWAVDGWGSASLFSGCSAATPLVAGVASLLLAVDPELGHDGVAKVLAASAADRVGPEVEDVPGRDDSFGHGRVDAAGALALVPEPSAGPGIALVTLAGLGGLRRTRARDTG